MLWRLGLCSITALSLSTLSFFFSGYFHRVAREKNRVRRRLSVFAPAPDRWEPGSSVKNALESPFLRWYRRSGMAGRAWSLKNWYVHGNKEYQRIPKDSAAFHFGPLPIRTVGGRKYLLIQPFLANFFASSPQLFTSRRFLFQPSFELHRIGSCVVTIFLCDST